MKAFKQTDREMLFSEFSNEVVSSYRKTARILAIQQDEPFTVETDRGLMTGVAGDWLVTNHPDDDPGSDLWTISAERMASTYEPVEDQS
jgi:hypothetical protein